MAGLNSYTLLKYNTILEAMISRIFSSYLNDKYNLT